MQRKSGIIWRPGRFCPKNADNAWRLRVLPAVPEDAAAICRLNREELGYAFPPAAAEAKLRAALADPAQRVFAAEQGGCVAGYIRAQGYDTRYAPRVKNVPGITAAGRYRRRGAGRALPEDVACWAAAESAAVSRLVPGAKRTGAHAFSGSRGQNGGRRRPNFKKYF